VPILPYLFDHPVEHVTEVVFDWIKERVVGLDRTAGSGKGKDEL
jgi:fission process protein 1